MGSVQSGKDSLIHEEGLRVRRDSQWKCGGASMGMDWQDAAHEWTSKSRMGSTGDTQAMGIDVGPNRMNSNGMRGPG